jgi:PD-(D/E)XK nuclease superfamily
VSVILRTSERRSFKRCPAQWWWAYREGLKPRGAEKTPLWFGTGVHLAFANWYLPGTKRGVHPAETFTEFAGDAIHTIKVADATEEQLAEYEEGASLGVTLMEEYVKLYGTDPKWHFISAEQTFSISVPWPTSDRQTAYEVDQTDPGELVSYKGTFDGVYRDLDTGRIELLETKTAKSISLGHLTIDDQAGSYWAVAGHTLRQQGLIKPTDRIAGINYNFVRKGLPDARPRDAEGYACNKPVKADYQTALGISDVEARKMKLDYLENIAQKAGVTVLGERSKVQPPPVFQRHMINRTGAERQTQLRRIQDEAVHMQVVRDGLLPIIKNTTWSCHRDCDYFAMCELQERQGNWEDFKKVAFRVQDPYADHRKSAED